MGSIIRRHYRVMFPMMRRALWLLMAVAHAPALVSAWRTFIVNGFDLERLGGCTGLTLAMVFFALKIRGVAFLQFRADRRSCVALCMVVALLHLDVIRPNSEPTIVPECTMLAATTWLVGFSPPLRRVLNRTLTRGEKVFQACRRVPLLEAVPRCLRRTIWLDAFRPHCWILALRLFQLRAPPA